MKNLFFFLLMSLISISSMAKPGERLVICLFPNGFEWQLSPANGEIQIVDLNNQRAHDLDALDFKLKSDSPVGSGLVDYEIINDEGKNLARLQLQFSPPSPRQKFIAARLIAKGKVAKCKLFIEQ
jgi:hypothetical protein